MTGRFCFDHFAGGCRGRDELLHAVRRQSPIEGVGGGHRADQDKHDQAHALLAVVGAVKEAHQGAGEDQNAPNPPRWRLVALRLCIERHIPDHDLQQQQ